MVVGSALVQVAAVAAVWIATAYPPLKMVEHAFGSSAQQPRYVHSPTLSASASNKMQTDLQSVALIIVALVEGGRLLGWISTLLA
jgi:F0F1-type ATP synthase membrane subunit c/vacuolar-type H+-ATPase subunit K